tara:strand:+ start:596 stop:712 length:117 start_codon:yes stop_codon:yes gene_type:complete
MAKPKKKETTSELIKRLAEQKKNSKHNGVKRKTGRHHR